MADFPSLPLYTDAFIADTGHLDATETGAYLCLLMAAWRSPDCSLPNDETRLARMARCNMKVWHRIRDDVMGFWTLENGTFTQKRLTRERQYCDRQRANKQRGAVAANEAIAAAKALKDNDHDDAERTAEPPHSDTQPIPTPNPIPRGKDGLGSDERALEWILKEAAGWEREPAPMLAVTGPIESLIAAGASLEADVLPILKALGPQVRSRTSWKYFMKPITQARDDRLAALKVVSPGERKSHARPSNNRKGNIELGLELINGGDGEGDPPVRDDEPGDGAHTPDQRNRRPSN